MIKNFLKLSMAALIAVILFSCSKDPAGPTSITLTAAGFPDSVSTVGGTLVPSPSFTLKLGQTDTIKAVLTPLNASGGVSWSSSNPAVVSIDQSGFITALATGMTTITATPKYGSQAATCLISVSNWTVYHQQIQSIISAIAIDVEGNKWLGGDDGLLKFDGTTVTTYNTSNSGIAGNYIRALTIDAAEKIWMGTDDRGVSVFDGINWITYNISNSSIASNHITCVAIDVHQNKWFGTDKGLSEFDGTGWTTWLPDTFIAALNLDARGNLWIGGNSVWEFDGTYPNLVYTTRALPGIGGSTVYAIAFDSKGNQWFGTEAGVYAFDGSHWTVYNHSSGSLPDNWVGAINQDANGIVWVSTLGGVSAFDGTNWAIYNSQKGPFAFGVGMISAAIDPQGNKWFGSFGLVELYNQH